uniref:Intraflagellar transport protein 122 n=1 Tax=Echinococcus granulosus TaxID=6210 RepID=A0A068WD40_ECHGR|nr:intraflagellar transport protein 122 [Echinococcus granulosus]
MLAVCDWSERLSFYHLAGKQVLQPSGSLMSRLTIAQKSVKGPVGIKCGKDRYLGFIPMCMKWIGDLSEYLAIAGQNRKVNLYSYEGCQLGALSEENSWILSSAKHPREKCLIIGCQDGTIRSLTYSLPIVHSFFRDRYAFREIITDVVIQHLVTEQRGRLTFSVSRYPARIKCRDVVEKIAVYRNRLAIQLSDRILIYESALDDAFDMHYRIQEKVMLTFDCQLLLLTSQHIVYFQGRRITCINSQSKVVQEWRAEAPVQCTCQQGGLEEVEGLIIGMSNGQINCQSNSE